MNNFIFQVDPVIMKHLKILLVLCILMGMNQIVSGQTAPVSQIEGYFEVFHPSDITSTYIGRGSGQGSFTDFQKLNTFVGSNAGHNNTSGSSNSYFGYKAGNLNMIGSSNSFFGTSAGTNNEGSTNSFFGVRSGFNNTGFGNSFFGFESGTSNLGGIRNTFLGREAGKRNTSGSDNIIIGSFAGIDNVIGSSSVAIGSTVARYDTMMTRSVYIGNEAGSLMLGDDTGRSGNIFLGYKSGFGHTGSNKLFIENSAADSSSALIYGEFDNDILALNANVGIGIQKPTASLEILVNDARALLIQDTASLSTKNTVTIRNNGFNNATPIRGEVINRTAINSDAGIFTHKGISGSAVKGEVTNVDATQSWGGYFTTRGSSNAIGVYGAATFRDAGITYGGYFQSRSIFNGIGIFAQGKIAGQFVGDLQVDTTTLYVSADTDKVGIGTTSPITPLQIGPGTSIPLNLSSNSILISEDDINGRSALLTHAKTESNALVEGQLESSGELGRVVIGSTTGHDLSIRRGNVPKIIVKSNSVDITTSLNALIIDAPTINATTVDATSTITNTIHISQLIKLQPVNEMSVSCNPTNGFDEGTIVYSSINKTLLICSESIPGSGLFLWKRIQAF